jgi:hypothetical protein
MYVKIPDNEASPGIDVMICEIFSPKKMDEKNGVFCSNCCKNLIVTFFWKKIQFFRRKMAKIEKIVIIACNERWHAACRYVPKEDAKEFTKTF